MYNKKKVNKKTFNWSKFFAYIIVSIGLYLCFAIPVTLVDWIANL